MANVKKIIQIVLLVVIIIINALFLVVWFWSQGSGDNYFNKNLRINFIQSSFLRNIFSWHDVGEGRYDYLGKKPQKISINVYAMTGMNISLDILQELTDKIQNLTGKPVSYSFANMFIPYAPQISTNDKDTLLNKYLSQNSDSVQINLFILSQSDQEPNLLGLTYKERSIIIFNKALEDFTKNNPTTFSKYQLSTILHEFGHQLGLNHNDKANCLMAEHAEINHLAKDNPADIVVDFCDYEKQLIKQIN